MKYSLSVTIAILMVFFSIQLANAHSGRTNSEGCHNDYIHGGYHCHNEGYYAPPADPWVCRINGIKYYTHTAAKAEWNRIVDKEVDDVYQKLLGRNGDALAYAEWENKFAYNNCKSVIIEPQKIWDVVLNSGERKQYLAKLEADKKTQEAQVAASQNTKPEVAPDDGWQLIVFALFAFAGFSIWIIYSLVKVVIRWFKN